MIVLVTGASGWVGKRVCTVLSSRGCRVVGTDLREVRGPWDQFHCADITRPFDLKPLNQIDAVIHCAGFAHQSVENSENQSLFYRVNREGTRNIVGWCERHGVRHFLYLSTIALYDWSVLPNEAVDETHRVSALTHYAQSKLDGERLVIGSELDWRIVRLATVFGEGDRANFAKMARAIKRRRFFIPGDGDTQKSVIEVGLAAELVSDFALMSVVPHKLINMSIPKAPSLAEICDVYHRLCGTPQVPRVPIGIAKAVANLGSLAAFFTADFPFTSRTLEKLTTSTSVSTNRMLACFPNHEFGTFAEYFGKVRQYYQSL